MRYILQGIGGSILFTLILIVLPLTRVPSYESAMAINIFILLFYLYLIPKFLRISIEEEFIETTLGVFLTIFIIPLIILIISGFFNGFCPGYDGFVFYFILNAPLLILLFSISLILRKIKIKPCLASFFILIILLSSLSFNIYKMISEPVVKFYSIFWGYFSGPIYDEDVAPDNVLILYRVLSILISIIILLLFYKRNFIKSVIALFLMIPLLITGQKISELEYSRDNIISILGSRYETRHFNIIYPPDQEWSKFIKVIGQLHEYYYNQLISELKVETDIKITSFIFRDEEEKKRLTGAGRTQIAKPWLREIYITPVSLTDAKLKHEISHIIAGNIIDSPLGLYGSFNGLIPNMAVVEGIAVALEPETNIMTLHEKAAILLKKEKLPSFIKLFNVNNFYTYSGGISYSTSGSFIRYLIDKYGIDKFKQILKNKNFLQVYSKHISEIEKEYRLFLKNISITPQKEFYSSVLYNSKGLVQRQCPHELAYMKKIISKSNKNYDSTIAYNKANKIFACHMKDSELILELAKSLILQRRYDEAEILILENIGIAENAYYRTLMLDILSDIYIFKGDIKNAFEIIEDHLSKLPDSDARRNYLIKKYLYYSGDLELLKKFYTVERTPLSKSGILVNSIFYNRNIISKYLYGRLLFNVVDYENCIIYLLDFLKETIIKNGFPKSLILEAANMLLTSSIFIGDYGTAEEVIKLIEPGLASLKSESDYHFRRYAHIRNFYYYVKN